MIDWRRTVTALFAIMPAAGFCSSAVLPAGTDLGDAQFERPREVFHSEAVGGHKTYQVVLGDVAFSSPKLLGGAARQAGISCSTCHVNGASNSQLFIPEISTRPGNFDTTSHLFNPRTDNQVLDPLTIPSLRGARLLAPYGHDGRMPALRDFVHNVIVNEFAGPEPSPAVLDAVVAYVEDIDFVANQRLTDTGRLTAAASRPEQRGEKIFNRSCAGCHRPAHSFVDHQKHDVGSGGAFKTPTLLNANFNAPYFHDGRFDSYQTVVDYFDTTLSLRLSSRDKSDLVAYLNAVGDGDRAVTADDVPARVKECTDFATALDISLPKHDGAASRLVLDTLDRELRELTEKFPDPKDPNVSGGLEQRAAARSALKGLVLSLREIDLAVEDGQFEAAAAGLGRYREKMQQAVAVMEVAKPWSLFDLQLHDTHFAALKKLNQAGSVSN